MKSTILVAGATGELGHRIVRELLEEGASVRALVRPAAEGENVDALESAGASMVFSTLTDRNALVQACRGVSCVVSAVQGLREVIVDAQSALLDAAIAAGVPRFIPSDFCSDYTQQPVGENRNFDLRREFNAYLDSKSEIAGTSILNGAFAELLTQNLSLFDLSKKQVGYWGDPNWRMDFTTMENVAAYAAAVAMLEPLPGKQTPRILRIASFQASANDLAKVAQQVMQTSFELVNLGSVEELAKENRAKRAAYPESETEVYPEWQRGQYAQSMFSVHHRRLDNGRYGHLHWTSLRDVLAKMRASQKAERS